MTTTITDIECAISALDRMAEAFEEIEHFIQTVSPDIITPREKSEFLSPNGLGEIAASLCMGRGYEPAFPSSPSLEDLRASLEEAKEMMNEDEEE